MKQSPASAFAGATPAPSPLGPAPSVEVRAIRDIPEDWAPLWDDLAAHAAEPNCFAARWFMMPAIRHLAGDGPIRMLAIWQGRALIGLMPVTIARNYGRAPVRHVQNWLHFHNFLGTPLIRAGHEADVWTAILESLDQAEWAPGFLHINGLVEDGPVMTGLRATGRRVDVVHRVARAMLQSDLGPTAYYEATVRKKKRKEIARLAARLAEKGTVSHARFGPGDDPARWCDAFLALEMSGWKGRSGSALGCTAATRAFLDAIVKGAATAGQLDFVKLSLNGQPIAMLLNLLSPPGSFSFKIAFDEAYARFSPGVLIQLENLNMLERPGIAWMDSCAVEDHPMINSLWAERRALVRVSIPLGGVRRGLLFHGCRMAENALVFVRRVMPARRDGA
ncbi:GNAT family N-acetyltransferase [Sphingobium boeckii]|uniref:CelD/BcsL family acetyltransferase involved in cellulose biosynthesis n=1 Tax=Sphingobium boeckii TaxID=1082345 RepID=A0A7W9EFE8_9SPHN|nr:GNAT family N-acetyltransferase [Sphingobium boeckii]MBB5687019.1 CelD/BcsL family acetyltransferase involved in cellulose biosynthesis [Sphingobium boeckii]